MDKLDSISFKDQKAIFGRLEQIASQANLTEAERERYETEWKIYNDYFNTLETAEKKGLEKGLAEGERRTKLENARNFKALGVSSEIIMKATGLSVEEIDGL